ncbi:MAG TPA: pentapeptide repeat-containing protein [Lachnospiraceae bacterium]|nr:pentapeptide repeat-containing protein [Lachnospiraceae bacterium]
MTKRLEPLLAAELETVEADDGVLKRYKEDEERVQQKRFHNLVCEETDFSKMTISGVIFENCRFWNCSFVRTEFTDVMFQSCDLSGCNMSDSYMNRVTMRSCKGVGTRLSDSVIKNLLLTESNFNYANFDAARLEQVKVECTELNSSNVTQCRCKNVVWKEVQLVNASFFKTSLRGMDFSDSTITGLVVSDDNTELRGAIVDLYQAAELARRLGIVIKNL